MANTQMSIGTQIEQHRSRRVGRILATLALVLAVAAGGWWALQSGFFNPALDQGVAAEVAGAAPVAAQGETAEVATANAGPTVAAAQPIARAVTAENAASSNAPTARIAVPVIGGVQGAPVWSDAGNLVAGLGSGAAAQAVGRTADNAWLAVETDSGAGWVPAGQVIAYGIHKLPVLDLPAAVAARVEEAPEQPAETVETVEAAAGAATASVAENTQAVEDAPQSLTTLAATVATTGARLNVRSGPGADYPVIAKSESGAAVTAAARNEAGDWLLLQLDSGEIGWAAAAYLAVDGDGSSLPLSSAVLDAEPLADSTATSESAGAAAVAAAPASATGLSGTLVFQDDRGGTIWVYELATGALHALTNGSDPAISPDGSTVAFVRDGGESGLYLIGIDGSNERRIFERVDLSSPKWSPDGQWILFARGDEIQECYEMGPNQCITYSELVARFPGGLPDNLDAPLVKKQLYHLSAVDANGAGFHDIPATLAARAPDWSEGGITYQSAGSLQRTADAGDDANQAVLFDALNPAYYDPDWQPNGGQIAFTYKGAAQWDIYVVNSDGSGKTALTRPATTLVDALPSNVAPAYSPDGQHIVFLSNRTESGEAGAWRLWVMDADGSNQQALPVDVQINYNFGAEQVVSWGL